MDDKNVKLKPKVGTPAVGDDEFFGREAELRLLIEKVTWGNSVYISAPRRIGKTSLMQRAEKVLEGSGHSCFFYTLEGSSPADWIYKLAFDMYERANVKDSVVALIKNVLSSEKLSWQEALKSITNSEQWDRQGKNFFKALHDSCPEGKRIVILLDELAIMVQNMQDNRPENEHFLEWLRSIHQEYHKKISFVIASSIGLHPLLKRLKLSTHVNYLENFQLDAWRPETAKECILALSRGTEGKIEISPETAERMTEMIGWCSPYYVQAFFSAVHDFLTINKRVSCSIDDLQEIYYKHLIRSIGPTLCHMEERLGKSLSKQENSLAREVLNMMSLNDGDTAKAELRKIKDGKEFRNKINEESFRNVIDVLEHDGYIEESDAGYHFLSKLLRDWWRKRYGN